MTTSRLFKTIAGQCCHETTPEMGTKSAKNEMIAVVVGSIIVPRLPLNKRHLFWTMIVWQRNFVIKLLFFYLICFRKRRRNRWYDYRWTEKQIITTGTNILVNYSVLLQTISSTVLPALQMMQQINSSKEDTVWLFLIMETFQCQKYITFENPVDNG